jgi:hypothetical protein
VQPVVSANRPCGRAFRAALAALVLVASGDLPAQADVGSARRPKSLIAIGPSFELDTDASMRFGGEVTLAQYSRDVPKTGATRRAARSHRAGT